MKFIFLLILFFHGSTLAFSLRVQGIGANFEQAKQHAFKTAIELYVGSVLVTEQESHNNKLIRNEIINYSSGYVDNYTIINTKNIDNRVIVIADVSVSTSRISNRILGTSTMPKIFDSDLNSTRYNTYIDSKNNADRLLNNILNDYPRRAFVVTQGKNRIGIDINRNPFIEIDFIFSWNYNYLVSLNEVLSIIEDGSNGFLKRSPGNIVIMAKDPKDFIVGKKSHYKFNDVLTNNKIKNRFVEHHPKIKLSIHNQNNTLLYTNCYTPESITGSKPALYSTDETLIVYGNQIEKNIIRLHLSSLTNVLSMVENIELSVVESCKQ